MMDKREERCKKEARKLLDKIGKIYPDGDELHDAHVAVMFILRHVQYKDRKHIVEMLAMDFPDLDKAIRNIKKPDKPKKARRELKNNNRGGFAELAHFIMTGKRNVNERVKRKRPAKQLDPGY